MNLIVSPHMQGQPLCDCSPQPAPVLTLCARQPSYANALLTQFSCNTSPCASIVPSSPGTNAFLALSYLMSLGLNFSAG